MKFTTPAVLAVVPQHGSMRTDWPSPSDTATASKIRVFAALPSQRATALGRSFIRWTTASLVRSRSWLASKYSRSYSSAGVTLMARRSLRLLVGLLARLVAFSAGLGRRLDGLGRLVEHEVILRRHLPGFSESWFKTTVPYSGCLELSLG